MTTAGPPVPVPRLVRPAPRWWRDAVGVVTWASMLVVVALWVADGGLQGLGTEPMTTLGRLTGLISADLLLIQVFLMARVPVIERSYGQDELARRHRLVGFTSFNLMLAHIVLIILGYAATLPGGILGTTWDLIVNYPGMLLALAGTVFLVLVVVTSIRKARARLRYESWHLLHLYAYLGVGLSIPHEIWTGADFTSTAAQLYWWSAYAVAAGAVLIFRIGMPAWRSVRHQLVVTQVVREAPGVMSVYLRGRQLNRLPVRAGQFFIWRFLDGPGWTRGNPYSLSAAPDGDLLRITVKDLGAGSARLARLRPGTRALIEGPYGRLTSEAVTNRPVTLLASGIGVTPLRALLDDLARQVRRPGDITLIYRVRGERDIVFRRELDAFASTRAIRVFYVQGPRARRRDSWLPEVAAHLSDHAALLQLVPGVARNDVYICGADRWMDAAVAAAQAAGVPRDRIHRERFTW
jgi:ferredoxin-NADP reductase/DMSO/TMAO reductase YedYZ heme-binding membrane subunit